jgi:hypothetical protein
MLKHLLRGFARRPAAPPPRRALPAPAIPVTALVPVHPPMRLTRDDAALADEDTKLLAADLEEAFAIMRARQHIDDAQKRLADGEFLVTMGVVEKFAYDCLDFGPERTHHIEVVALGKSFEQWLRATGRYEVRKAAFARAMTSVLEWQGGHRSTIGGRDLFVGCRLSERFAESLTKPNHRMESKARLGMGLTELSGGRPSPG